MTTEYFILTRAVHFGACLLFFGLFAFDRFVAAAIFNRDGNALKIRWQKWLQLASFILLPLILLSGFFWLLLIALTISGQPPTLELLNTVWTQTQFGTVWHWRFSFWLAAVIIYFISIFPKLPPTIRAICLQLQLLLAGLLLGSLAWAGHGTETSVWHLAADILHLLVAGFWPTGLLPLLVLLHQLRSTSEADQMKSIIKLVQRFSFLSLASVALLAATGLVNSWFLIGSFADLWGQPYGRWLLLKIILFGLAVAIGAVNLLRLKPRLKIGAPPNAEALAHLRRNVKMELFLGVLIVMIVAILGILPPTIH